MIVSTGLLNSNHTFIYSVNDETLLANGTNANGQIGNGKKGSTKTYTQ